jgi:hypothetical protein
MAILSSSPRVFNNTDVSYLVGLGLVEHVLKGDGNGDSVSKV